MEVKYKIEGAERKRLAAAVAELLDLKQTYLGAPTFAYVIGDYRIDRLGTLNGPDAWELVADLSGLYSYVPVEKSFDVKPAAGIQDAPPIVCFGGGSRPNYDCDYNAEGPQANDCESQEMLTIEMPLEGFSQEVLSKLDKLIASKADLIRKMIGADALTVERTEDRLRFPWFRFGEDGDKVAAYARFVEALCSEAKEVSAV